MVHIKERNQNLREEQQYKKQNIQDVERLEQECQMILEERDRFQLEVREGEMTIRRLESIIDN